MDVKLARGFTRKALRDFSGESFPKSLIENITPGMRAIAMAQHSRHGYRVAKSNVETAIAAMARKTSYPNEIFREKASGSGGARFSIGFIATPNVEVQDKDKHHTDTCFMLNCLEMSTMNDAVEGATWTAPGQISSHVVQRMLERNAIRPDEIRPVVVGLARVASIATALAQDGKAFEPHIMLPAPGGAVIGTGAMASRTLEHHSLEKGFGGLSALPDRTGMLRQQYRVATYYPASWLSREQNELLGEISGRIDPSKFSFRESFGMFAAGPFRPDMPSIRHDDFLSNLVLEASRLAPRPAENKTRRTSQAER